MTTNKPLLIIGCYLDTDVKKGILRKNLEMLNQSFDVLLASHYPVDADIQRLAKYTMYDSNNDIDVIGHSLMWYHYDGVYFERHQPRTINASLAVYHLIRNSLPFAKTIGYDSFFYVEGDLLFHEKDINVLFELMDTTVAENKSACFFKSFEDKNWIDCQLFYSDIDFFMYNVPVIPNLEEFNKISDKLGTGRIIEPLLYKLLYSPYSHKVKLIEHHPVHKLPNSSLNCTGASHNPHSKNFMDVGYYDSKNKVFVRYTVGILRLIDTNDICIVYHREGTPLPNCKVYINNEVVLTVNNIPTTVIHTIWKGTSDTLDVVLVDNDDVINNIVVTREYIMNNVDFVQSR